MHTAKYHSMHKHYSQSNRHPTLGHVFYDDIRRDWIICAHELFIPEARQACQPPMASAD